MEPADSWLRNTSDDSGYLPDQDGNFDLQGVSPNSTLSVEGTTLRGLATGAFLSTPSRISGVRQPATTSPGPPIFRPVTASNKKKIWIKIKKATLSYGKRKKPEFDICGELYVEMTEATANVGHVCEAVRSQWGQEYTVVTAEGFEIVDTAATQGLQPVIAAPYVSLNLYQYSH